MAAKKKKPRKKAAKKPVRKVAKKSTKKSKSVAKPHCPNTPEEFFERISEWSATFLTWATEVETAYDGPCGTPVARIGLDALCVSFTAWAAAAKKWADGVEACFESTPHPPDHTKPPEPPF